MDSASYGSNAVATLAFRPYVSDLQTEASAVQVSSSLHTCAPIDAKLILPLFCSRTSSITIPHRGVRAPTNRDLPCEIIDIVISNLRGNDAALRAYSLTCRAWRLQAQKELHRANLFEYGHPIGRTPERYSTSSTVQIFRRFSHLRCLAVTNTEWYYSFGRRAVLVNTFAHVTSLRLSDVRFAHVEDFLCFISAFDALLELRMDGVR